MVLSVEGDIKESKCSGFAVSCMIHIAILKSMDTMQAEPTTRLLFGILVASYGCMGLLSIAVLGLDLFLLPRMCAAQSGSFNYCIYSATAIVLTVLHYLGKGSQASSASTLLQVCCARSTHFVTSLFCCWQSVVLRTMCTGSTKPHGHIITIL